MLRKVTTFFILVCFLSTQSVWALPAGNLSALNGAESPSFFQIKIPTELASLEEVYEAPTTNDSRLVLHIQDLHGSYEAQTQIKELLQYLHDQYGFKLLFLEGANAKVDPDYLRLFPDEARNLQLVDNLAKMGEVTGSEMFLMQNSDGIDAVGVENAQLYKRNYRAFQQVHQDRDKIDVFLKSFEQEFDVLSSRIFSRDMQRLVREWKKFEQGHRDFLPFVQRLANEAKKFVGLDLESLFAQVEWPQITRLLVLQTMEQDLNHEQVSREKALLMKFLKAKKVSGNVLTALEDLGEQQVTISHLTSHEDRLKHDPRYLLERLAAEAGPKGFHFYDYPAFSLWAGHQILRSELDTKVLFAEIDRVFTKILDELAVLEREKTLLELLRDEELLRKLLHLELNRKEWERAQYRRDWITPASMVKRARSVHQTLGGLTMEASALEVLKATQDKILKGFNTAFSFYNLARQRDTTFYNKIMGEMKSKSMDKALLVTGGFHTQGITDLFRDEGVSYGVLTPRIQGSISQEKYLDIMLERRSSIFDLTTINIELLMRSESRSMAQVDVAQRTERVLLEFISLAGFDNIPALEAHFNKGPHGMVMAHNPSRSEVRFTYLGGEIIVNLPADGGAINPARDLRRIQRPVRQPEEVQVEVMENNVLAMTGPIDQRRRLVDQAPETSELVEPPAELSAIDNKQRNLKLLRQLLGPSAPKGLIEQLDKTAEPSVAEPFAEFESSLPVGLELTRGLDMRQTAKFAVTTRVALLAQGVLPKDSGRIDVSKLAAELAALRQPVLTEIAEALIALYNKYAAINRSTEWGGTMTVTTDNPVSLFEKAAMELSAHPEMRNTIVYVVDDRADHTEMEQIRGDLNKLLEQGVRQHKDINGAPIGKRLAIRVTKRNRLAAVAQSVPHRQFNQHHKSNNRRVRTAAQKESLTSYRDTRFAVLIVGENRLKVQDLADSIIARALGLDISEVGADEIDSILTSSVHASFEAALLGREIDDLVEYRNRPFSFLDLDALRGLAQELITLMQAYKKLQASA